MKTIMNLLLKLTAAALTKKEKNILFSTAQPVDSLKKFKSSYLNCAPQEVKL